MMELERLLKAKGHEVAVFSMQYPENEPSEWSKYWPSNMSAIKAFTRPFGDAEVKRKFSALLDDFKPDVIHIWGTEYLHTYAMREALEKYDLLNKTIIHSQGLN